MKRRGNWQGVKGGIGIVMLDVVVGLSKCVRHQRSPLTQGNAKYVRIKDLNAGAFGFVVLARDTETDEAVAIKFMKRNAVNKVSLLPVHSASVQHFVPNGLTHRVYIVVCGEGSHQPRLPAACAAHCALSLLSGGSAGYGTLLRARVLGCAATVSLRFSSQLSCSADALATVPFSK